MRRVLSLVLLGLAVVLLAGCQTDAFLEVQVDADGGGAVYVALAMDQDAAAKSVLFEGKPPNVIPVDDLTRAGWTVTGPTQEQDGRIWMRASKPFSQLDQLSGVVSEVAGPDGPFRDFTVERSSSFGQRSWQFSGTVDLSKGIAGFSDDGVAAAFGGEPLGQPADVIAQQVGTPLEQAVKINVVVDLPGDVEENNGVVGSAGLAAPTTSTTARVAGETPTTGADATPTTAAARTPGKGAAIVWNPTFADPGPVQLQAASSSRRLLPRIWRWAGLVAGLVGAVALVYRLGQTLLDHRRDRRRAVPRPSYRAARGDEAMVPAPLGRFGDAGPTEPSPVIVTPAPVGGRDGEGGRNGAHELGTSRPGSVAGALGANGSAARIPGTVGGRGLGLIVIETTGALVAGRDPVGDVLVPFARERGCVLSVRQVADLFVSRATGATSGAEFWSALGLAGDPVLLDDTYARRFELTDHVIAFLSQARQRGVAVAALGDDVPEWTAVLRQRFKLDSLISHWISSAEVGVRVPHPALLEAVERETGVTPGQSMVIGASRALLDAAGRAGYRTVQYNPGPDDPDSEHPVLRSFAERGRPAASPTGSA